MRVKNNGKVLRAVMMMMFAAVLFLTCINPVRAQCSELNSRGDYEPEEINLTGVDFQGVDFSNRKFLRKMNFKGANFTGANLTGVSFYGVDFYGVTLKRANLTGADLSANAAEVYTSVKDPDDLNEFETASHEECWVWFYADLGNADLTDAKLNSADLTGANLKNADLTGADLTGAKV